MVYELIERGHQYIDVLGFILTLGGTVIVATISYLNVRITNMINVYMNEVRLLEQKFGDLQNSKNDSDAILLDRMNKIGETLNQLVLRDNTREFIEVFVTKDVFIQKMSTIQQDIDEIRRRCYNDKM
jgi:hypothetical protein